MQRADHRNWLAPALLFLIIACFYWRIVFTKQYEWIWAPDLVNQVIPWFQEEARQWHQGHFPLWDSRLWAGQPFLGQAQPGAAYPLNWILFSVPLKNGQIRPDALRWYLVAMHYTAALFCYLLCRDLGRSRTASLLAGLVFALSCLVGNNDWPQMVNGAVWTPLIFMFILRAVRGERPPVSAALAGACLGAAWLSGHHQIPMYTTVAAGLVWLYYILRAGRLNWGALRCAAIFGIFMLLVGALQILPANEYGRLAKRWAGTEDPIGWSEPVPYYVHQRYSLNPHDMVGILYPGLARNADAFVGAVALSLALLAVAMLWRDSRVKFFSALAIGGLVYSFGQNSPFHGMLYALTPGLEKARVPANGIFLFGFGVAVLLAFGADVIPAAAANPWPWRTIRATAAAGLFTLLLCVGVFIGRKLQWDFDDRVMITALTALLMAALLYAWQRGNLSRTQASVLLTLLLIFELGNDSGYTYAHQNDKSMMTRLNQMRGNDDIARFLQRQPRPFRIESGDENELAPNWGEWQGLDAWPGYLASTSANLLSLEFFTWQTRALFGVKYSIGRKPNLENQRELFQGVTGLKVYENPAAFPRYWTVHEMVRVGTAEEGQALVREHLFQMRQRAFTREQPPALAGCAAASDHVTMTRYEPGVLAWQGSMACDGLLVDSDTFYPGWEAAVDGRPVRMYEVNGAMRGVPVPAGAHGIEMRYRPRTVHLGAALTALGTLGAFFLAFFSPKRARAIDLAPESRNNTK